MSDLFGSPRLRRALGLTAVPALALSTLAALPSAPANAAESDPAPLAAGTDWMEDQLQDGPFSGPFTEGLSIDAVLALKAVDGDPTVIDGTVSGLESRMQGPSGYVVSTEGGTYESGGSAAKAAVMLQRTGGDPTAYAGLDLVEMLESLTSSATGLEGRVFARFNGADDLSFTNTPVQAFAAEALHTAGSDLSDESVAYLLLQQCDDGFFREEIPAPDGAQSCDAEANPEPSVDSTALAVLALHDNEDAGVQPAVAEAIAWLREVQEPNGAFGSTPDIPTPNTNSTGLAGWALGEAGETAAAEKAAIFVRALQVDEPEPCATALNDDQGAIAYDGAALVAGRQDGITVELEDQWRRASAQALPALRWATGEAGEASAIVLRPFYQAGTRVQLTASGFIPGDTVCFRRGSKVVGLALVGLDGSAKRGVTLPHGTARRIYQSSTGESEGQPLTFHVLDKTKLKVELKPKVAKGGTQVVRIRGLEKGESFKVIYRGEQVDKGKAKAKGKAVARFKVGQTTGPVKVQVRGQFKDRRGAKAFTVTR